MSTYIIASKATQPFLPECQMLGEFMETNCPDVTVKVVIKSNEDWGDYIDAICRSYGFYERYCPFVYTLEGESIGDGSDFIEHVRNRYCRASISINKQMQDGRSKANMEEIEELMRKRQHGLTLKEKIEVHQEKVGKKEVISQIGDSFFGHAEENGMTFMLRRTNLQRDNGRTLNIVDEIEVEENQAQATREAEEAKDMTFEDFQAQFKSHIEGTAPNEREVQESDDDGGALKNKQDKPLSSGGKRSIVNDRKSQLSVAQDNDSIDQDRNSLKSRVSSKRVDQTQQNSLNQTVSYSKYDIPNSCMLTMMKKVLIEKLAAKYFLSSHPYPKIEGELIIFKPKKDDQDKGKDVIVYRDYSLRKRNEAPSKPALNEFVVSSRKKAASKKEEIKTEDTKESKLQCLEMDIQDPLSFDEWQNFATVIEETQGFGWFQVLPVGQKSSMPYQFNMLHVIPQAKIPVSSLPIDSYISNHLAFLRKKDRNGGSKGANITAAQVGKQLSKREENEELAIQQGLLMIPEFEFEHCLFQLNSENLVRDPAVQLKEIYSRCSQFLQLQNKPNVGISVLISPRWFLVAILTQPYCNAPNGNPVYLDGFDFAGLFSLQTTSKTWPATAGLEDQNISVLQALDDSTRETKIQVDEDEDDYGYENDENTNPNSINQSKLI